MEPWLELCNMPIMVGNVMLMFASVIHIHAHVNYNSYHNTQRRQHTSCVHAIILPLFMSDCYLQYFVDMPARNKCYEKRAKFKLNCTVCIT